MQPMQQIANHLCRSSSCMAGLFRRYRGGFCTAALETNGVS
ncbi:hypothetical protein EKH55_5658 (plasmid) [Sinorhizobium alkalisoli]|nr:hypothetical protein EKH55_5658 [Sinorhizobium alkalisoli]